MKIDNLEILNGLIAGAEGGTVEFKETTGQLERGMETLCAFLNGTGGTVLFGVTDKGKIIGQEVSDKTKRDIAETIRRIEPFATIDISYTDIPGTNKSVIALSRRKEQRYMRPFTYKGGLSTDRERYICHAAVYTTCWLCSEAEPMLGIPCKIPA